MTHIYGFGTSYTGNSSYKFPSVTYQQINDPSTPLDTQTGTHSNIFHHLPIVSYDTSSMSLRLPKPFTSTLLLH